MLIYIHVNTLDEMDRYGNDFHRGNISVQSAMHKQYMCSAQSAKGFHSLQQQFKCSGWLKLVANRDVRGEKICENP